MKQRESILVLGDHSTLMSTLAERIPLLGFQCARAKTPQEAIDLAHDRNFRFGVALIEADFPVIDIAQALDSMRAQTSSPGLTFLVSGDAPPDAEARERLRRAGVAQAVWAPVSDHVLRFQLNAALSNEEDEILRCEPRAPLDCGGVVTVGGRSKQVGLYCVSGAGAFLVSQRPSMPGAEIRLDIRTKGKPISFRAKVLYASVPGNLSRPRLPHGMAVRFIDPDYADADALRDIVIQTQRSLTV